VREARKKPRDVDNNGTSPLKDQARERERERERSTLAACRAKARSSRAARVCYSEENNHPAATLTRSSRLPTASKTKSERKARRTLLIEREEEVREAVRERHNAELHGGGRPARRHSCAKPHNGSVVDPGAHRAPSGALRAVTPPPSCSCSCSSSSSPRDQP